jgi:hypothetical protein
MRYGEGRKRKAKSEKRESGKWKAEGGFTTEGTEGHGGRQGRRGTGGREKAKSEKRESGKWKAEGGEAERENEGGKVGEVKK